MTKEPDLGKIGALVDRLESVDAFERRDAIERLALMTQQRFEFRWTGGESERAQAVQRWRTWIERERKRRKDRRVRASFKVLSTLQISGGKLDMKKIEAALHGIPEKEAGALLEEIFEKLKVAADTTGALPPCERCGEKPSTVHCTERRDDGTYERTRLCEVCAGLGS